MGHLICPVQSISARLESAYAFSPTWLRERVGNWCYGCRKKHGTTGTPWPAIFSGGIGAKVKWDKLGLLR